MRAGRGRIPKNFVLEDRLERYKDGFETHPMRLKGRWKTACFPSIGAYGSQDPTTAFSELFVDLGCGKGSFIIQSAAQHPTVLFVGLDSEAVCIAYAAQHAVESGLPNVIFFSGNALSMADYFAPGEIDRIYMNFPTPFPKKRDAHLRLPRAERLHELRPLLKNNGELWFKTDSKPLYDFFLTQLPIAGWKLLPHTDAAERLRTSPKSEYEQRLTAEGAYVYSLICSPTDPAPEKIVQTSELSLTEYLPHTESELKALDYAPLGMKATVINLTNRETRKRMHAH